MASIEQLYRASEYAKLADKSKDKTPIENDGGLNLSADEGKLEKARGGKLSQKKYSDTLSK
jgi:hypothetical protein